MRGSIFLLTLILLLSEFTQAQQHFPEGIYFSMEQLVERSPESKATLNVIPTNGRNYEGPINEFRFTSDSLRRYYLRNKVFAYSTDTALYINCERIDRFEGIARSYTSGNFLVFHSPNYFEKGKATVAGAMIGGLVGAAIGAAIDAAKEKPEYWGLYVLSLRTRNVRKMTEEYLFARLQDHDTLRHRFSRENFPSDDESLIHYMQLINLELETEPEKD